MPEDRPPTTLRDLIVFIASLIVLAAVALFMLAHRAHAQDASGDAFADCAGGKCTVSFTLDGRLYECGKMRIWKNPQGQKWAMVRFPCKRLPLPSPTPSPLPTAQPVDPLGSCTSGNPAYCWGLGSRLTAGGGCWSNCSCVLRSSGGCAQ